LEGEGASRFRDRSAKAYSGFRFRVARGFSRASALA
jgi:hypothetical protein